MELAYLFKEGFSSLNMAVTYILKSIDIRESKQNLGLRKLISNYNSLAILL